MDRLFEYIKTHRAFSALIAATVVVAILFLGIIFYGNDLPDDDQKASTNTSSTSQTSSSTSPKPSVTSPADTSTSTSKPKSSSNTSSTSAKSGSTGSVNVKTITVTGASGAANDATSSWQFPISASVTMNKGGNVPLTFTFNLSTGESQVVQSSDGTAGIVWTLPHCQEGSFTVTVTGVGPARTSNKGYATWDGCN